MKRVGPSSCHARHVVFLLSLALFLSFPVAGYAEQEPCPVSEKEQPPFTQAEGKPISPTAPDNGLLMEVEKPALHLHPEKETDETTKLLFDGKQPSVPASDLVKKPVIYLYPEKETDVKVQLHFEGKLTATYPAYDEKIHGWQVKASPDGQLLNLADHQTYSYLFWEGEPPPETFYDLSTGFVVAGKDTAAFLQKTLKTIGLTPKEYNEFIVYWLPKMGDNAYNLIHFAQEEYTETAPLTIEPAPDSMLRVFMVFRALDAPVEVDPQPLAPFTRKGFAVIEWGGSEVR